MKAKVKYTNGNSEIVDVPGCKNTQQIFQNLKRNENIALIGSAIVNLDNVASIVEVQDCPSATASLPAAPGARSLPY